MPKDLRTYLDELVQYDPCQLRVVEKEVDPVWEATSLVDKMVGDPAYPTFPAVFFKNVKGSKVPNLLNLHATYERLAVAIGTDVQHMVPEFGKREGNPIPPREVRADQAPVKEVIWTGDQADLSKLPLLQHMELDAGKYISSAAAITRDPDTGKVNAGIFRHQLQERDQLGFMTNPAHHTSYILRRLRDLGVPRLEVALAIGHHPAMLMGSVSKLAGIGGEFEVMGGLLGEPLEVVPAETVDLPVPARAEIIIEGIVETDPARVRDEGPFGEYPRYYTGLGPFPWLKVTAITMRHDAIFVDVFNAHAEHSMLGGLPRMGSLYRRIRQAMPTVTAVNLPLSGMARSHLYIAMQKKVEGEPKIAACAAFSVEPILKHIWVVDDDVDVFNEQDVLWAFATRFQADRDMCVMPNFLGGHLNPVTYGFHREQKGPMETKLIFDCTKPAPPEPFPPKAKVPDAVKERLDTREYLRELGAQLPWR